MLDDLPDGLTSRPATMQDAAAVTALLALCEQVDDGAVEIDVADVLATWRSPATDLQTMTALVLEDAVPVGYGEVVHGRAEVDVHPEHRGRGIGTALLRFTWDVARADGRERVGQTISDGRTDAAALLRDNGYEPQWTSWILRIETTTADAPGPPPGYDLRPFDPTRDTVAAHAVIDDAFNEWPGREPSSLEDWSAFVVDHDRFVADASPVAVHDDAIVGVAMSFDYPDEGWIHQLAVQAAHRHRGLGGALLRDAFARHAARGRTVVGLNTDTRTGAIALYEAVGMQVRRTYTRWSKDLTDRDDPTTVSA